MHPGAKMAEQYTSAERLVKRWGVNPNARSSL